MPSSHDALLYSYMWAQPLLSPQSQVSTGEHYTSEVSQISHKLVVRQHFYFIMLSCMYCSAVLKAYVWEPIVAFALQTS